MLAFAKTVAHARSIIITRAISRATTCVTMTTADGREVMAICGEEFEANGQSALGGKEIKGEAMSLQEAFLQFRRKKQVIKSKNTGQGMIIDHVLSLFSG